MFRKKKSDWQEIEAERQLDRKMREIAALEPWKDYKPKWQARENIDGKYNLYYEKPVAILGSVPEEDEVTLVWEAVEVARSPAFMYLTPAPYREFNTLIDVEIFLRRSLHPHNVDYDSNGDKIK